MFQLPKSMASPSQGEVYSVLHEINLLPWRELKRTQEMQQWRACLLVVSFFAIVFTWSLNLQQKKRVAALALQHQQLQLDTTRVQQTLHEMQALVAREQELLARTAAVQQIASERELPVRLLSEWFGAMPQDITLERVEYHNPQITLWGKAYSNQAITAIMRYLEQTPWTQSPQLVEVKINALQGATMPTEQEFQVHFSLHEAHEKK